MVEGLLPRLFCFLLICRSQSENAVGFGQFDEVRAPREIDMTVAVLVEELLPLAHHAETLVVNNGHFHRDVMDGDNSQFLSVHLEAAVAVDGDNRPLRMGHLRPDGRRKAKAHRPEAARRNK